VGEIARGLDREDAVFGNRIPPPKERLFLRQPVKGIVDLSSAEATSIVLEEGLVREARRIKRAFPMIVIPAGRADIGAYSFTRALSSSISPKEHPDARIDPLYKPLFLCSSHANLQGPVCPGTAEVLRQSHARREGRCGCYVPRERDLSSSRVPNLARLLPLRACNARRQL
jgi:hypothetical protein